MKINAVCGQAAFLFERTGMLPYFYIFGRAIPLYWLCAVAGGAASCGLAAFLAKKRGKIPAEDIFYMLLYAGIGCLFGAKLLYLLVSVDTYWLAGRSFSDNMRYWYALIVSGGMVFYGGLIGAFLGALRYCLHFKIPVFEAVETAVPAVPLFHFFGRIGCFMSGCCYGIEYDGILSVTFTDAVGAPNGIPLLPIQLFEAAGNLLLCGILTALFMRNKPRLCLSGLYLVCYGAMRFGLEFFRGDSVRGSLLFLSTSQWISLAAICAGTVLMIKTREQISKNLA